MFLLMMILSFWAEDPAYIVNEENCKFGHYAELPNDYRSSRLITECIANIKEDHKPTKEDRKPVIGERAERTVRPLKELMRVPAESR